MSAEMIFASLAFVLMIIVWMVLPVRGAPQPEENQAEGQLTEVGYRVGPSSR